MVGKIWPDQVLAGPEARAAHCTILATIAPTASSSVLTPATGRIAVSILAALVGSHSPNRVIVVWRRGLPVVCQLCRVRPLATNATPALSFLPHVPVPTVSVSS